MNSFSSWSIVAAAGDMAAIAGVMSGFSFAGLIYVLTRTSPESIRSHGCDVTRHAIGGLALAALVAGVAAFEWALVAGESNLGLVRPEALAAMAGSMLVLGVLQLTAGIIYLVVDFNERLPGGNLGAALVSICRWSYSTLALLATFYIGWATTDAIRLGVAGWPRSSSLWNFIPLVPVAISWIALQPHNVHWTSLTAQLRWLIRRSPVRINVRRSPALLLEWRAATVAATFNATLFGGTFALVAEDSVLATAGEWPHQPVALVYILMLMGAAAVTVVVVILQGVFIEKHIPPMCRSDVPCSASDLPAGRDHQQN